MNQQQREFICALMDKQSPHLTQLAFRRLGDWHLAEDLLQETFLIACCKPVTVCGHEKPVAWLYDTLGKLIMREQAKAYHAAEHYVSEEDAFGTRPSYPPMEDCLPEGLTADERTLILMRVDQGRSFEEIADHFGIDPVACRKRFSRVVQKCRQLMEREHSGESLGV